MTITLENYADDFFHWLKPNQRKDFVIYVINFPLELLIATIIIRKTLL